MRVFPNPATDAVYVYADAADLATCNIQLTDMTGKIVFDKAPGHTSADYLKIETTGFAKGLYVLNMIHSDGTSYSEKILIQ